ncbi:MAG TPA: LPS-assembly protein LptD, partial [Oxalobacteraceae bacterium]|nr:LPS-assembly protein LptD [Oxalobacteraceae bacterium]
MTRFLEFPSPTCFLHVLSIAVTAASVPALAQAQVVQHDAQANDKEAPSTISAEQMTGHPDREVTLERDVEITRGALVVNSDHAVYRQVEDQIEASGHVRMQRFGDHYTGDELKLQIDTGQGYVLHPTYHLARNNAQGKAQRIDFEAEDRARVTDGTYSTCEGPDPDWYLKAATLDLDTGTETGVASRTILYFKGAPIVAAPTMSFPLSDARKSGLLPPTLAQTSNGGLEVMVPYYFNIAPNRDLTVYPKIITRRGLQLGASGRYLSETYSGQTNIEVLPNDQQTKTDRYSVSSTHTQTLLPGLTYAWNLNAASDDDYPNDFSHSITVASQRLLLRDMSLNYGGSFWSAAAHVSNYQVLQDPAAPIGRPYERLPQLTWQAGRQDVNGFDWNVDADFTRFWDPDLVRGDRSFVNTRVSYPLIRPGYFVTPRLALDATTYRLNNAAFGAPTSLTRVVPTLSLDSGLVFERTAQFRGETITQTLEPRLFYVRTPYRDQSLYPIFDSAEADLSFAQLFTENRFVGHDRISDANQLTAALVSRYIEPSGAERLRFALGQRFYFSEQRVTLG